MNDARLLPAGDHPAIIQTLCRESGQPVPESKGEIVRCVLESLAVKYGEVLSQLLELSGRKADVIHIMGGGSQNDLLNQLTADATGIPVKAGPVEATVLGNSLVQFIALGEIKDLDEGRKLVADSFPAKYYQPKFIHR